MSWKLSDKAYKLREEYFKKYNKKPRGWDWENESMNEYEEILQNALKANNDDEKLLYKN